MVSRPLIPSRPKSMITRFGTASCTRLSCFTTPGRLAHLNGRQQRRNRLAQAAAHHRRGHPADLFMKPPAACSAPAPSGAGPTRIFQFAAQAARAFGHRIQADTRALRHGGRTPLSRTHRRRREPRRCRRTWSMAGVGMPHDVVRATPGQAVVGSCSLGHASKSVLTRSQQSICLCATA